MREREREREKKERTIGEEKQKKMGERGRADE